MTEPAREPLVNRIDRDGVAAIELNRPARKNAIIPPMLDELAAVVNAVNADSDVHAVLLRGAGGVFCSGLDLTEYSADPPPAWLVSRYPMATVMQVVLAGERVPGPELHRLGIAYEVVADEIVRARAEELAATIAAFPPGAARRLKTAALRLAESGPVVDDRFARAAALAPAAAPPPAR